MSRQATSFVLGYHGCDRSIGERAIRGEIDLLQSDRDFDWLGPGAYFWESDPRRALEWSRWKVTRGDYSAPFVVGAVINLRNCLDLVSREDLEIVKAAYSGFIALQKRGGLPIPKNGSPKGQINADRVLRFLDCAVLRHLHRVVDRWNESAPLEEKIEPYDTVRGMFTEGGRLYPGAGFRQKSHVQIAVRRNECILGLFKPLPYPT